MPMTTSESPKPFPVSSGYTITVSGGTPPYTFTAPPNPPGITLEPDGNTCKVNVPTDTPTGTNVNVGVSDSSNPPQTARSQNTVS